MKKVVIILLSIWYVIGVYFIVRYSLNESFISKYNQNVFDSKIPDILKNVNFSEKYIAYYNKGNSLYKLKEYDKAITEYEIALKTVPSERECLVRTNLSLASLEVIDYEDVSNLSDRLIAVEKILLEKDCAKRDGNGKDKSSQKLYDKIEELLNLDNSSSDSSDSSDTQESEESDDTPQNSEEIEQILQQQQSQSIGEREEHERREYSNYYRGKKW